MLIGDGSRHWKRSVNTANLINDSEIITLFFYKEKFTDLESVTQWEEYLMTIQARGNAFSSEEHGIISGFECWECQGSFSSVWCRFKPRSQRWKDNEAASDLTPAVWCSAEALLEDTEGYRLLSSCGSNFIWTLCWTSAVFLWILTGNKPAFYLKIKKRTTAMKSRTIHIVQSFIIKKNICSPLPR